MILQYNTEMFGWYAEFTLTKSKYVEGIALLDKVSIVKWLKDWVDFISKDCDYWPRDDREYRVCQ